MMTRKDYIAISDVLNLFRNAIDRGIMEDLVSEFADMLQEDNSNFNRKRFAEAVFGEEVNI